MTNARANLIRRLHAKGMTYEEIGAMFGISKQAVHQATLTKNNFNESAALKIKYKGLREWMIKNQICTAELERRCETGKLHASLVGKCEPSKKNIDAILRVTGLTYEDCFKEDRLVLE